MTTTSLLILGAVALLTFLLAFHLRGPHDSPVRKIYGKVMAPHWEIESLCWRIAKGVELSLQSEGDRLKVVPALRTISVRFLDPQVDNLKEVRSWGLYRGGALVKVVAGRQWRQRLCFGLAHALRLEIKGDADKLMKDQAWFKAAFLVLDSRDDARPVHDAGSQA